MKKLLIMFAMVIAVATSCKKDAPESTYDLFEGRWVATNLMGAPVLTFVGDMRIFFLQYITADPTDFETGEFSISGDQVTLNNISRGELTTRTFKFSDNNNTLTLDQTIYQRQTLE